SRAAQPRLPSYRVERHSIVGSAEEMRTTTTPSRTSRAGWTLLKILEFTTLAVKFVHNAGLVEYLINGTLIHVGYGFPLAVPVNRLSIGIRGLFLFERLVSSLHLGEGRLKGILISSAKH